MMQEWTSFRNTIGYQFGQMWEIDGMKICHPCHSYILCLQRIAHYRAGTRDEALRISAREATVPLRNTRFGHLWYITKFLVIRHRPPGSIRHTFHLNSNIPTVTQFVWVPCVKNSRNGSRSEHLANRYLIKFQIYNYNDN